MATPTIPSEYKNTPVNAWESVTWADDQRKGYRGLWDDSADFLASLQALPEVAERGIFLEHDQLDEEGLFWRELRHHPGRLLELFDTRLTLNLYDANTVVQAHLSRGDTFNGKRLMALRLVEAPKPAEEPRPANATPLVYHYQGQLYNVSFPDRSMYEQGIGFLEQVFGGWRIRLSHVTGSREHFWRSEVIESQEEAALEMRHLRDIYYSKQRRGRNPEEEVERRLQGKLEAIAASRFKFE